MIWLSHFSSTKACKACESRAGVNASWEIRAFMADPPLKGMQMILRLLLRQGPPGCTAAHGRRRKSQCYDGLTCRAPCHRSTGLEASRSEEHTSELQSLMRISYAV